MNKILEELTKKLKKINPLVGNAKENDFLKIDDWISTGNHILNLAISGDIFKGIPCNRITALSGESGVGKTFILLNIYKNAQKLGYTIYHFDTEGALSDDLIEGFELDTERLIVIPVSTLDPTELDPGLKTQLLNMLKDLQIEKRKSGENLKVMIGLDSLGNLASAKEVNDTMAGESKVDMTRAKQIRSLFRMITIPLAELKIPFLVTNHTYSTTDMYAQSKMGGGEGLVYGATNIIEFSKAQDKNEKTKEKVGIIVTAKIKKNRFAVPKDVKFKINFKKGMNPYIGLQDYCKWDICGIERGKLEEEIIETTNENGKKKKEKTGNLIFIPSATARGIVVKHLNKSVELNGLYNDEVFSKEVLEQINEVAKRDFSYKEDEVEVVDEIENEIFD